MMPTMRKVRAFTVAMAAAVGMSAVAGAQAGGVASTPPMGWNSWDAYGLTITEAQFRANVSVIKNKLAGGGWRYAVIDEGWFFENPEDRPTPEKLHYALDPYGRYVPAPVRFPSAGDGVEIGKPAPEGAKLAATIQNSSFVALADWVHAQGMLFGIHIVRGIPRASVERNLPIAGSDFHAQDAADQTDACPWDPTNWGVQQNAAGQAWYDSLLKQYASWGVDLLKVDCIGANPYNEDEIDMIRQAIDRTGRPIVLSLSPGPMALEHATEAGGFANMWRISDDEWDQWDFPHADGKGFPQGVLSQFARLAAWEPYAKPGNWPDADMLAIGELRPHPGWGEPRASHLGLEEEKTLLTLWSIARSPLIIGANLTLMDAKTLWLLGNPQVVALDQEGTHAFEAKHEGAMIAWRSSLPKGREALAVFNTGETPLKVQRDFEQIDAGLGSKSWSTRDVWADADLGRKHGMDTVIPPHGCQLLLLEPEGLIPKPKLPKLHK
jgi:hypothetical protein